VNESKPTHLDLCSGTGAFSIAFEAEGFETIGFAEIEEYCCKLLDQNWPHVKNYGDVRNVPTVRCSVITSGIPCQPISGAGLQLGEKDHRYIWKPVLSVVERCGPDWVVIENVINVTNLFLASWQDDLEAIGYQSQAFDIPSCAVGLSSVERHVWLVASRDEKRTKRNDQKQHSHQSFKVKQTEVNCQIEEIGIRPDLPSSRLWGGTKGASNRMHRVAAIGNAVPPPIAQIFARAIRQLI